MTAPASRRVVGIDPGAHTGLVCLAVAVGTTTTLPPRWVGSRRITSGDRKGFTEAENAARLYSRIREQLIEWCASDVAIEEPWDNVPTRLQQQGTAFWLGSTYGLALAAAHSIGARIMSYPVTSAPPKEYRSEKRSTRVRPARTGWMPTVRGGKNGNLVVTQDREVTLASLDVASRALRLHPANGVLTAARASELPKLSEDERMALGVALFHLSRQPLR